MVNDNTDKLTASELSDLRRYAVGVSERLTPTTVNTAYQQTKKNVDDMLVDAEKIYQFLIK